MNSKTTFITTLMAFCIVFINMSLSHAQRPSYAGTRPSGGLSQKHKYHATQNGTADGVNNRFGGAGDNGTQNQVITNTLPFGAPQRPPVGYPVVGAQNGFTPTNTQSIGSTPQFTVDNRIGANDGFGQQGGIGFGFPQGGVNNAGFQQNGVNVGVRQDGTQQNRINGSGFLQNTNGGAQFPQGGTGFPQGGINSSGFPQFTNGGPQFPQSGTGFGFPQGGFNNNVAVPQPNGSGFSNSGTNFSSSGPVNGNDFPINNAGSSTGRPIQQDPLPLDAHGDQELVNYLNTVPEDKRPFWFLNYQAIEAQRNGSGSNFASGITSRGSFFG